jgi:putative N6-adenine-specific DNA methylase
MQSYFATCARGLESILAKELTALGASEVEAGRGGASFQGNAELLYRANLWLRTAVRVLRPILEEDVHSTDALYEAVRTIDWSAFLTPDHTLAVDCNVRDSAITHSQYAARRVKDAICDQFRDKTGRRPSVDVEQPMLGLNLHVHRDRMTLSLDSSWGSLHKRGYRPIQTIAPLNEALAAGLILHSGWDPATPLVDPLCGSGTFCIEAAWIALDRPPGLTRKWFGFQGWLDFDRPLWNAIRDEARRGVRKELPAPIRGSDIHRDALELARHNARAAGIGHLLAFERLDIGDIRPTASPPGAIICNPPYGERLGEEKELVGLYRKLGETFATHWPGWKVFVFTGNDWLARKIPLKKGSSTPFFNGRIPCRLWRFDNAIPRPTV